MWGEKDMGEEDGDKKREGVLVVVSYVVLDGLFG